MDNQETIDFLNERIESLTQQRKEQQEAGDFELDEYIEGVIDAYDIIRMRLTEEI
jgi:hypothetical protein